LTALDPDAVQQRFDKLEQTAWSFLLTIKKKQDVLVADATKGGEYADRKISLISARRSRLKELIQDYQHAVKLFREALRHHAKNSIRVINPNSKDEDIEAFMEDFELFGTALKNSNRKSDAEKTLQNVRSRLDAIVVIGQKIAVLNKLFEELGTLIEVKDPVINQIEKAADKALTHVKKGGEDVKETKKIEAGIRRKKWWLLLIAVLIVIAIIIAVVVTQVINKVHIPGGTKSAPTATPTAASHRR
jgi:syntaxin 1B/2/3